jgi:hypothetical protein
VTQFTPVSIGPHTVHHSPGSSGTSSTLRCWPPGSVAGLQVPSLVSMVCRWSPWSAAGVQGLPLVSRVRGWSPQSAAGLHGPLGPLAPSPLHTSGSALLSPVPFEGGHPRTRLYAAGSAGTFLSDACPKSGGSSKLEHTVQTFEPPGNRPEASKQVKQRKVERDRKKEKRIYQKSNPIPIPLLTPFL